MEKRVSSNINYESLFKVDEELFDEKKIPSLLAPQPTSQPQPFRAARLHSRNRGLEAL